MSIIILIPAILAAYVAWTQSPHRAFIFIYVPVLLFFPGYYHWKILGIPDPNFSTATILTITAVWLIRGLPGWRFSFTDLLVFGYTFSVLFSEFHSPSPQGKIHYQNFVANFSASVIFPYLLAKSLVEPAGLREAFAKSIVIVLFIVAMLMIFQFITQSQYSIQQSLLGRFFGGEGWVNAGSSQKRWGVIRIAGPYGHEILAGIVLWVGYRIQRWLEWSHAWPPRLRQFPWLPISTARLLSLGIFAGGFVTLARGPIIGAIVAAFIPLMGLSKRRWLIFWVLVALSVTVGIPIISWFISYASIDPGLAETRSQETVVYRWQLVINYFDIAMEHIIWGWGRFGIPRPESNQKSIDNHFLLLLLQHGIMGLGFFWSIFVTMTIRLFFHSMLHPVIDPPGSSLGFTLLSLYVLIFVSVATVWLGGQTVPLFFLIVGWSEGYLRSGQESLGSKATAPPRSSQSFQFRRILK